MKKLFLITLIGGLAVSAQAQDYGHRHDRDNYSSRDERFSDRHRDELERRMAFINNDFNNRIESVRHYPFLRAGEKRRKIRELKRERNMAMDQCRNNFSRSYATGYDRYDHQ